jgi:polysaccharide export outer membrane protein
MNARLIFKATGLLVVTLCASGWLGCAWLGKPHIEKGKELNAPTTVNPVDTALKLHVADAVTVRLDLAAGREEHIKVVDEYGNIELPFVGKIKIVDLTPTQAQDEIYKLYVPKYYTYLTVTVQAQSSQRIIYLVGEVRQPGATPYREDMTVWRTIVAQGGFNEYADRRHLVLTRGNKRMCIDCIEIERNPEKDIPLHPGDMLNIPRLMF